MKDKLKQFLKVGILTLCIAMSLTNCEKEEEVYQENSTQQKQSNLNLTVLRAKDVQSNTNLMRIINKAEKKVSDNKAGRVIYNAEYDFTINTDYAKVIENNGLNNYTFGVYRSQPNGLLENLLLQEQADSTFKVSLVQYNITPAEKNSLINRDIIDAENKITFIALDDISDTIFSKDDASSQTCIAYSNEHQSGESCYSGQHTYSDGAACWFWQQGFTNFMATNGGFVLTVGEQDCGGGGGSPPGPNGPPSGNPSGGNPNGGNGTNTIPPDTTPVLCPECPEIDDDDCFSSDEAFNESYSLDSPFNVDLSEVRASCDSITPPKNEKLLCIYNKLRNSPSFKNLFINTFGESKEMNVKIKATDNLMHNGESVNGFCERVSYNLDSSGNLENIDINIEINGNLLSGSGAKVPFQVAKTIIHEAIHAYLYVKILDCGEGTAIAQINESTFEELIDLYFENSCSQNQDQHDFMINYMLPTMVQILSEIKDPMIPMNQQNTLSGLDFLIFSQANNGPLTESTIFSWPSMYYYLSLSGLHNTDAYDEIIPENSINEYLRGQYLGQLNTLSKNCYE